MSEKNRAVAVWPAVRAVLLSPPRRLTSLKSAVYFAESSAGGPAGRNWLVEFSISGLTWASHGSKNGVNVGGVGRHTPGAGGVVNGVLAPRPSFSRSAMIRAAARSP